MSLFAHLCYLSLQVRKKSTKVREMEEFEEAEKKKPVKKGITSPTPLSPGIVPPNPIMPTSSTSMKEITMLQPEEPRSSGDSAAKKLKLEPSEQMIHDTSVIPQTLPKPAISVQIDPALANLPPLPPSKFTQAKKAKKKDETVTTMPVTGNIIPPLPPPSIISPATKKLKGKTAVKTVAENPELVMMTKSPPIPEAQTKKKAGMPIVSPLRGDPSLSPIQVMIKSPNAMQIEPPKVVGAPAPSKSVIKMLLNTPTNFATPSVSTTSIQSEKGKLPLQGISTTDLDDDDDPDDHFIVKSEEQGLRTLASLAAPDYEECIEDEEDDLEDGEIKAMSSKKVVKKTVIMYPDDHDDSFMFDDEDDDLDDEEEEEEEDYNDNDESADWEFENADGKLVIAEMAKEEEAKAKKKASKKGKASSKKAAKGCFFLQYLNFMLN